MAATTSSGPGQYSRGARYSYINKYFPFMPMDKFPPPTPQDGPHDGLEKSNPLVTISLGEGSERVTFGPYPRLFLNQFSPWFSATLNFQDYHTHISEFTPAAFRTIERWLCPWLVPQGLISHYNYVIWDSDGLDQEVDILQVWHLAHYLQLDDFANGIQDIYWTGCQEVVGAPDDFSKFILQRDDMTFIDKNDFWNTQIGEAMRYALIREILNRCMTLEVDDTDSEVLPKEVVDLIGPTSSPIIRDKLKVANLLMIDLARAVAFEEIENRLLLRCDITHFHPTGERCEDPRGRKTVGDVHSLMNTFHSATNSDNNEEEI